MQIKSTKDFSQNGVKILVYSAAGAGKTSLIPTLPNPIILSAESGLLSISKYELPYIEITTLDTLREAYMWLTKSEEAQQFESVALDSISEIAEVVLNNELKINKDPRKAYGEMQSVMGELIRSFRDVQNKHVYFSAKLEKTQDELGRILQGPSMPGNKLSQLIPYFFDEVLALRVDRDADGNTSRALMCDTDGLWTAKDRSGKLDRWEAADLGHIIRKIGAPHE